MSKFLNLDSQTYKKFQLFYYFVYTLRVPHELSFLSSSYDTDSARDKRHMGEKNHYQNGNSS